MSDGTEPLGELGLSEHWFVRHTSLPTSGFDWLYEVGDYRESGLAATFRGGRWAVARARRRARRYVSRVVPAFRA